jgi:hypothetical protein
MNAHCDICGKPSATIQADLFGGPKMCIGCVTNARIDMMLKVLPKEDELAWERLSAWEQGFLPSVRQQFARKGTLSEAQYQSLEKIYQKHN